MTPLQQRRATAALLFYTISKLKPLSADLAYIREKMPEKVDEIRTVEQSIQTLLEGAELGPTVASSYTPEADSRKRKSPPVRLTGVPIQRPGIEVEAIPSAHGGVEMLPIEDEPLAIPTGLNGRKGNTDAKQFGLA